MDKKVQYDLMFFTFITAIDVDNKVILEGATICDCEWSDSMEALVPKEDDMLKHFYTNVRLYGRKVGCIEIVDVNFIEIEPKDNLLINLN